MKAKIPISKKITIIVICVVCAVLLIPIPCWYKDGGTFELKALLWSVRKEHSIAFEQGSNGYDVGTIVRVLFLEVYNDVRFVPSNEIR